jgi:hypothetical protein
MAPYGSAVWVEQGKTRARPQIDVVGELAEVIERA